VKKTYYTPYIDELKWTKVILTHYPYSNRHAVLDKITGWCYAYKDDTEYAYIVSMSSMSFWFEDKDIALIFRMKWSNEI